MQMASAMPRRRVNQREVSATRGAKVAEVPSRPINSPCASVNCHRLVDALAAMKPRPRPTAPPSTGTITPYRSESLPMRMPPTPKPIMVSVYGKDAAPRSMPKSAWMLGNTTVIAYMPAPPSVMSASDTASRHHA
jgi:hypothetical protein